jgi:prolyl-tRNA synthetase
MMGGLGAHEYMAPCAAGEDEVALGEGYAANVEVARNSPDVREEDGRLLRGDEPLVIEAAIEVGNIFMLGTRYSEPLGARYLDEHGNEQPIWMGSYGIGPARIVAAAVEQFADEHGISWPRALAPFEVHLVVIGSPGSPEREAAEGVYRALREGGVSVIYDDRDVGPGEKFADAELLGSPLRLTVGRRALEEGSIEVQIRRGRAEAPRLVLSDDPAVLLEGLDATWAILP